MLPSKSILNMNHKFRRKHRSVGKGSEKTWSPMKLNTPKRIFLFGLFLSHICMGICLVATLYVHRGLGIVLALTMWLLFIFAFVFFLPRGKGLNRGIMMTGLGLSAALYLSSHNLALFQSLDKQNVEGPFSITEAPEHRSAEELIISDGLIRCDLASCIDEDQLKTYVKNKTFSHRSPRSTPLLCLSPWVTKNWNEEQPVHLWVSRAKCENAIGIEWDQSVQGIESETTKATIELAKIDQNLRPSEDHRVVELTPPLAVKKKRAWNFGIMGLVLAELLWPIGFVIGRTSGRAVS